MPKRTNSLISPQTIITLLQTNDTHYQTYFQQPSEHVYLCFIQALMHVSQELIALEKQGVDSHASNQFFAQVFWDLHRTSRDLLPKQQRPQMLNLPSTYDLLLTVFNQGPSKLLTALFAPGSMSTQNNLRWISIHLYTMYRLIEENHAHAFFTFMKALAQQAKGQAQSIDEESGFTEHLTIYGNVLVNLLDMTPSQSLDAWDWIAFWHTHLNINDDIIVRNIQLACTNRPARLNQSAKAVWEIKQLTGAQNNMLIDKSTPML